MGETGTLYFFTGLAGAGKTTIGTLFYERLKRVHPDAVLLDGDQVRKEGGDHDYSTEARKRGGLGTAARCRSFTEQGLDVVNCNMALYREVRQWYRENVPNYREIYVRVSMETLFRRDKKNLYTSGVKQVVGLDLPWDEPDTPDIIIDNDGAETPQQIVERLLCFFGIEGEGS